MPAPSLRPYISSPYHIPTMQNNISVRSHIFSHVPVSGRGGLVVSGARGGGVVVSGSEGVVTMVSGGQVELSL